MSAPDDQNTAGRDIVLADLDAAPPSLAPEMGPVSPKDYSTLLERFTAVSDENVNLKAEISTLTGRVRTAEILDALIKPYASKAFWFMCAYCAFVGALLLASGGKWFGFGLPEEVLKIMVGSTAVTVIGLVGMVLTGIFVGARKGSAQP